MPRLNIYVPDDLHELAVNLRGSLNLSAICARALREELEAADSFRAPGALMAHLRGPSDAERALTERFGLADAFVCETPADAGSLRACLGSGAAAYLDRTLQDGAVFAIAGGRQTWCVVRSLAPRRVRLQLAAIGAAPHDPRVLHAHPNTLVTLLSVLYAPRSEAHLVGSSAFSTLWPSGKRAELDEPSYIVLASCSGFAPESPYVQLLGRDIANQLTEACAVGDFAGVFMGPDHSIIDVPLPEGHASMLSGSELTSLATRSDSRIILVAGGTDKREAILAALELRLCNVLVTDEDTAAGLLHLGGT